MTRIALEAHLARILGMKPKDARVCGVVHFIQNNYRRKHDRPTTVEAEQPATMQVDAHGQPTV